MGSESQHQLLQDCHNHQDVWSQVLVVSTGTGNGKRKLCFPNECLVTRLYDLFLYWSQLLNLRKCNLENLSFFKQVEEVGKNKININIFYWLDQHLAALDEALPCWFLHCPTPILSKSVIRKDDGLRALNLCKQSTFPTVDLIALQRSSESSPWTIYQV